MIGLFELDEGIIFIKSFRSDHRDGNSAEKLAGHTDERVCLGANAGLVLDFVESAVHRAKKEKNCS